MFPVAFCTLYLIFKCCEYLFLIIALHKNFENVRIHKQKMNAVCTGGNGVYVYQITKQVIYEYFYKSQFPKGMLFSGAK